MAKVPDNPCSKDDQMHEVAAQSHLGGSHSSRSRTPCRRNDDPVEQTLTTVQEAHQKVLSAVSTLEKEIERLHCTQAWSQLRARSKSRDCHKPSGEGQKRRCCQVRFADDPAPSQSANLKMPPGKEGSQGRGSDLGELPELKLTVASFLQGSPETSDEEGEKTSPEPDIMDLTLWAQWKAERCKTPDCWEELLAEPGNMDVRKLAREVKAYFLLPQWLQELDTRKATLQTPPAPPCLWRKRFMPPANSIFTCRDIWEVPREKAVAYTRAHQYWAKQNKPPTRGEPRLLVRSVLELREEVRWYLSFTDKEIFKGVPLPKEEESPQTPGTTSLPKAPCMPEPVLERRALKFAGWEKVLHPSQPVVATGDIPWPTMTPRPKVEARQIPQMISMKPPVSPLKAPTLPQPSPPTHALVLAQLPTPPWGFAGVMACLHVPKLVEVDLEPPVGIMPLELVTAPGITSMSSSHIVRDELTRVTYMDMVTTSVGRVAISGLGLEACPTGPTIEDIMDCQ